MGELKKEVLLDTIRRFGGQPKTVTVHRVFVDFTGSLEAGMMLSQLLYWSERDGGRGRVAKSDAEWKSELCLTQYAVRQARKRLEEMEIVRAEVHRFNGVPTVHYFLLEDALSAKWELWIQNSVLAKTQEQSCESAKSLTESTTESTTAQQAKNPSLDPVEKTLPVENAIVLENTAVQEDSTSAADALFDAMHSQSEGMPPIGELTSAAVADPQAERKAFIAEWQPKIAQLYRLDDDATTARSVAAKLYDHRTVKRKRRMLDDAIEAVQREGLPPSPYMFVPAIVAKLEVKRARSVIKVSA